MKRPGGRQEVITAIEESLCSDEDVEFVVAFGSQSTGVADETSDFDVAVKFRDELSTDERFRKLCFLSGSVQRSDIPFVDVSDLEALPIDIARDAIGGEFLCGDQNTFQQVTTDVENRFEEQRDEIRRNQRDLIDRIAEDGLRG